MAVKRGEEGAALPAPRERRVQGASRAQRRAGRAGRQVPARSDVAVDIDVPTPPFWGDRDRQGHRAGRRSRLPGRAGHVHGPVGAQGPAPRRPERTRSWSRPRAGPGCAPGWTGSRPSRSRSSPSSTATGPCYSEGNDLIVLRARRGGDDPARSCTGSRSRGSAGRGSLPGRLLPRPELARRRVPTWSPSTWSPWAARSARRPRVLFEANAYRDYLELHGLSVQLTEALAEMWHARIRSDLGFAGDDGAIDDMIRDQATGARATPSATPPARTWRTGPSWWPCCGPSGSASSCPRSSSCTPSSPPTPSSCTTRRRSTSTPASRRRVASGLGCVWRRVCRNGPGSWRNRLRLAPSAAEARAGPLIPLNRRAALRPGGCCACGRRAVSHVHMENRH